MSVAVPTLEQFNQALERLARAEQRIIDLEAQLDTWIGQEEASRLSGYSRSWFHAQRSAGTLPIAYRKVGIRSIRYSRIDCLALGRKKLVQPPIPAHFKP